MKAKLDSLESEVVRTNGNKFYKPTFHQIMSKRFMADKGILGKQLPIPLLTSTDEMVYHPEDTAEHLLVQYMGGRGRYQWMIFCIAIFTVSLVQFPMGLISFQSAGPTAQCPSKIHKDQFFYCFEAEACEMIAEGKKATLYMDDTWTKKYNMICFVSLLRM